MKNTEYMKVLNKLLVIMLILGLYANIARAQQNEDIITVIDTKSSISNLTNNISLKMLFSMELTSNLKVLNVQEVNNTRILISFYAIHSSNDNNNVSVIAEWNPVPEEVTLDLLVIKIESQTVINLLQNSFTGLNIKPKIT